MVFRRVQSAPHALTDLARRSAASTGLRRVRSAPACLDDLVCTDAGKEHVAGVVGKAATEAIDSVEDSISNVVQDDILLAALFHVLWRRWSNGWSAETFGATVVRFALSVVTHHLASVLMAKAAEAHVCLPSLPVA